MRALGIVGGTSWHSTIEYYRSINQSVNDFFGDNTNPPLLLANLNQAQIHRLQVANNWRDIGDLLIDKAKRLQMAGAEAIVFAANTPHKCFNMVSRCLEVPILHIADATAKAIQRNNLSRVCFIGTRFSMEESFVTGRIAENGIDVLVPNESSEIVELHRIIQEELTFGKVIESSKKYVLNVVNSMVFNGAQGVVLGCTEFPLMIEAEDLQIPIFNTTTIHAEAATNFILSQSKKLTDL